MIEYIGLAGTIAFSDFMSEIDYEITRTEELVANINLRPQMHQRLH